MDKRQYYSALKTLEQLEHTFLPPVKGYIFSDLLKREIPKIRKSIQDKSIAELTVRDYRRAFFSVREYVMLFFYYVNHRIFWPKFEKAPLQLGKWQCTR